MLQLLSRLAAESGSTGPAVHITPSELFTINGLGVTNSILFGWIASVLIIILLVIAAKKIALRPKGGLIQYVEIGSEFITSMMTQSLGSRTKALKYAPYFTTMFFFILLNNWLGLIVGEVVRWGEVPAFRPFTADLNGTLAAALVIMVLVQTFAIRESGVLKHLSHYFNGSLKNPLTIFLGVFEMFSELIRVFSLALRLFLNVTIGEVIISVFTYLGGPGGSIVRVPFFLLELAVGALQAYIFVMLSMTYLSVAIKHGAEHAEEEHAPQNAPVAA